MLGTKWDTLFPPEPIYPLSQTSCFILRGKQAGMVRNEEKMIQDDKLIDQG